MSCSLQSGTCTHPLGVDEHVHLEEDDIVDGDVLIAVEDLEGLADRNPIDHRGREDERTICVGRQGRGRLIRATDGVRLTVAEFTLYILVQG